MLGCLLLSVKSVLLSAYCLLSYKYRAELKHIIEKQTCNYLTMQRLLLPAKFSEEKRDSALLYQQHAFQEMVNI